MAFFKQCAELTFLSEGIYHRGRRVFPVKKRNVVTRCHLNEFFKKKVLSAEQLKNNILLEMILLSF